MTAPKFRQPFVLDENVLLIPCSELEAEARGRISFDDGDFMLSRRRGRTCSQVIDSQTAALLALFREPRTIPNAVIENSRALDMDPQVRLDEVLPYLGTLVKRGDLVPAFAGQKEMRPQYEGGTAFAGWTIVRCLRFMEDSEVYELRNGSAAAALKIARVTTPRIRTLFANEAAILRHLGGSGIAPRLIAAGTYEQRPYLILEWIDGVDAVAAADRRRHVRPALLDLCASIADAYAALHACGVLHGDVHARNVLVGDRVVLLDFGYSRLAAAPRAGRARRAGVGYFFEPEYLAALRRGITLPPSPAGEQYALAALLYFLIADRHYIDFRLERDEMARQVENEPPRPFTTPWPPVERILRRALRKNPKRRYGSIAEMAAALARARPRPRPLSATATAFFDATLRSFAPGGTVFASGLPQPSASIYSGAAGAAVGLLRIAETRRDSAALALAKVWSARAVALIGTKGAYYDPASGLTRRIVGAVTPYLQESGIHAAAAMIAAANGDAPAQRAAIGGFLRASVKRCPQPDLMTGRSGSLLAAALLLAISGDLAEAAALRAFGATTMRAIWRKLDRHPPLTASPRGTFLGMAHGWAGYLYAALRWCAASGDPLPARLLERLHEHKRLKTGNGRGAFWRVTIGERSPSAKPGWCQGSAGQVFLFTLAHQTFGDGEWLRLAELAAWNTWEETRRRTSLCCGSAGRAYALLNLYRHTGAAPWLTRARRLAEHAAVGAAAASHRPNTLWQGELGAAVLIADLASPENARMPFFE